jgi:predicted alpha/beta-hydrolase family hydrolase
VSEAIHVKSVDPPVSGFLHEPHTASGDGLVLTHGAGANCRTPLLTGLGERFCAAGWWVLRCDLPFRQERAFGPPRGKPERDQQGLKRAVEFLRERAKGRILLGGHSYGGRQASMLAAEEPEVADGLLLLSYPLHPPDRPTQLRTAHFPNLRTPALFVSGTKDEFGTVDEITEALRLITAPTELLALQGSSHSLLPKKNPEVTLDAIVAKGREFFTQK